MKNSLKFHKISRKISAQSFLPLIFHEVFYLSSKEVNFEM